MSSYRDVVRRKQKCRRVIYSLISFVLVVYGLVDLTNYFSLERQDGSIYRSRHILQTDDESVENGENGSTATNNKTKQKSISVVEEFINSSNKSLEKPNDDDSGSNETVCQKPSIAEFPSDLFTNAERKQGAVIVHILVAIYMCVGIAIVCDYYFVPSLEVLCHRLRIQADVAGASLMAIGSSAPELCASIIGVFVTKGDIGIGTILGSAVFNLLFVIGICGIFASSDLKLAWWPVTRDTLAYGLTIVVLSIVIFDSTVKWQEALTMFTLYVLYLVFMWKNEYIEKRFYLFIGDTKSYQARFEKPKNDETTPLTSANTAWKKTDDVNDAASEASEASEAASEKSDDEGGYPNDEPENIIAYPKSVIKKIGWVLTFPIKLTFFLTIPDLRRPQCRSFVLLTFFMAISWIGFLTYTLVWMVTTIGFTVNIPDSIMGLTFVAFGSSVPDGLASMIVAKQGKGDMAVAQALGSNVFDILLGLGLPWTIKSLMGGSKIEIRSVGMLISCFVTFLLAMIVLLTFYFRRFILGKRLGVALLGAYGVYLVAAVTTELFLYADYQVPMCDVR